MSALTFTSVLSGTQRDALESLLFFNPNQRRVRPAIQHAVERYGQPRIADEGGRLRVRVDGLPDVQAIFALNGSSLAPALVGTAVFSRVESDTIVLLHLAVDADYASGGGQAAAMVALRLMVQVRAVASRIKGVRSVLVMYQDGVTRRMPV